MSLHWKCFIFILCVHNFTFTVCSKLNVPRILLPIFAHFSTNFTLEVTGHGCYKWSTSRPGIIRVVKADLSSSDECSNRAVISVLTRDLSRITAIVLAEDTFSSEVLRADVIVDRITTLEIVTTTRELFIEEPPEMFEVRGYDDQGNEFTSLDGVEFQWTVWAVTGDSSQPVIRLIKFSDSPYETPNSVAYFDSIGRHGHLALLEGTTSGSARVSVQLPQLEYKEVPPADVLLFVTTNIVLEPASVYMLPGDILSYKLMQIRRGRMFEIEFSKNQYSLQCKDCQDIARLEDNKVHALAFGRVEIKLVDSKRSDNQTHRLPTAIFIVAKPHYAILSISPHNTWVLTTGQKATIKFEMFDKENHPFHLGENVQVKTVIPELMFRVGWRGNNGSLTGTAFETGVGTVVSTFYGVENVPKSIFDHIQARALLHIYAPLSISPERVILTWNPLNSQFLYRFHVSGGDGMNEWKSENASVVGLSFEGEVKINGPGITIVSVHMTRNHLSRAQAMVYVQIPVEIRILKSINEVEVGGILDLNIVMYGYSEINGTLEKLPFDFCQNVDIEVTVNYPFYEVTDLELKPVSWGCAVKAIKSSAEGVSDVSVHYTQKNLHDSTTVASYKPLKPLYNGTLLLTIGSSYTLVFHGGPLPIFGPIFNEITIEKGTIDYYMETSVPEFHVYRVTCFDIGENVLKLSISTKPVLQSCLVAVFTSSINIACRKPKSIELRGKFKDGCQNGAQNRVSSHSLSSVSLNVIIKDINGSEFHNATSLWFKWIFDNETMAAIDKKGNVELEKELSPFNSSLKHYATILTKNLTGKVTVRCTIAGYKEEALRRIINYNYDDSIKMQLNKITASIPIHIVHQPEIDKKFLQLFNHPINTANVHIRGGSGFFVCKVTPKEIASVEFRHVDGIAVVKPLREGVATITISDFCLPSVEQTIDVQIIQVASIKVELPNKIKEGGKGNLVVKVFDKDDKPLSFPLVNLEQSGFSIDLSGDNAIAVEKFDKAIIDNNKGLIHLNVKAVEVGEAKLVAHWFDLSSKPVNVQVFKQLRVLPRNVTLLIGSEYQIFVMGGPLSDFVLNYVIKDPLLVGVSREGLLSGYKLGKTVLKTVALSHQGGEILCEDVISIHVIALSGVQIVAPIVNLGLGNIMPVWATGIPYEIPPLLLGSTVNPSLQFSWSVSEPTVLQIRDTLENSNLQVTNENRLSIRLQGIKPGYSYIELNVFGLNQDKTPFIYNSSVRICVVNIFKWMSTENSIPLKLIAPNSKFHLQTNSPVKSVSYYSVNVDSTFVKQTSEEIVKIDPNGLVTSTSNVGSALIMARTTAPSLINNDIYLNLKVKPVYYMMINIGTSLETFRDITSFPIGLHFNISISYHDEYGSVFFVSPLSSDPIMECNAATNVAVENKDSNTTFIIRLKKSGNITLRLFDVVGKQHMEDFIKIRVENYITPIKSFMTVGEKVCFSVPFAGGEWSTNNDAVLHISKMGTASAERVGTASVTFSLQKPQSYIISSFNVDILPLHSYIFGILPGMVITNAPDSFYAIPVFLLNDKQKKEPAYYQSCKEEDFSEIQCPFACNVNFVSSASSYHAENIFTVKADFNYTLGSYTCLITPVKSSTQEVSEIAENVTLTVANYDKTHVETLFLIFHPQFSLNTARLLFNKDTSSGLIVVSGTSSVLANIHVEATPPGVLSIGKALPKEGSLSYSVILDHRQKEEERVGDIFVLVHCSLISQIMKVPVYIDNEAPTGSIFQYFFSTIVRHLLDALTGRNSFTGSVFYALLVSYILFSMAANFRKVYSSDRRVSFPSSPATNSVEFNEGKLAVDSSFTDLNPRSSRRKICSSPSFPYS